MNASYNILNTPFSVGNIEIKNRFVLEPMEGTNIIDWLFHCKYEENVREYYKERSKNHVGLIIPGMVPLKSIVGNQWLYEHPEVFAPVKELMDEIHSYGAKLFFQLGAGWGRSFVLSTDMKNMMEQEEMKALANKMGIVFEDILVSASDMPNRFLPEVNCRALSVEEIREYVEAYGKTARLCKEAGVDGVEVHAVHEGYLLDQFTTEYTNHRTDEYGGSFENRYRFSKEVVEAIKRECGKDYPVSMRYSVTSKTKAFGRGVVPEENYEEIGRDLEEGIKAAKYLEDVGYDMLNADNGTYDAWFWSHPPVYMPLNCNLNEVKAIKKAVSIPVVCAGRMQVDIAEEAIREGELDAVGIARQFLTDPEFITKLMEEREEDILPCISCHNACLPIYHYNGVGAEITEEDGKAQGHCALNPRTFCEAKYDFSKKTINPKRIAIVGGGIGGMTVAMVAARLGHIPVIYEKTKELGGVFIAAAAPSFKEKDKELIEWYKHQMKKLNVEIHFGTEIKDLSEIKADEIVIACGARPRILSVPGADKVVEAVSYLREYEAVGERVAIIGGGLTGCEIAYDLARKGKKPILIEMAKDILMTKGLCMANSSCLREYLDYYKVPIYTNVQLQEVCDDAVVITIDGRRERVSVDSVIASCGYLAGTELITNKDLEAQPNVHLIGDVKRVANLKNVIWDAYDLAFSF